MLDARLDMGLCEAAYSIIIASDFVLRMSLDNHMRRWVYLLLCLQTFPMVVLLAKSCLHLLRSCRGISRRSAVQGGSEPPVSSLCAVSAFPAGSSLHPQRLSAFLWHLTGHRRGMRSALPCSSRISTCGCPGLQVPVHFFMTRFSRVYHMNLLFD